MARSNVVVFDDASVLIAAPADVFTLNGFVPFGGATTYVQFFDRTTVPVPGAVPVQSIPVAPGSTFSWTPSAQCNPLAAGLAFGASSTPDTYTAQAQSVFVRFEGNAQ